MEHPKRHPGGQRASARRPPATVSTVPTFRWQLWARAALILALAVAAYLPALQAGFIWDDDDHVTQNQVLEDGSGLRKIWFERGSTPQYYPLVHTSFWLERRLWGLNPAGYHATNILLHALAALLLWRVLVRLNVRGGYLAALLFSLHPLGVESVAWITERKNVLSAVFYLSSALAWLRLQPFANGDATTTPDAVTTAWRSSWYWLSLLFFVCAMFSKTVAASLPAAMLLMVWWKTGRVRWRDVQPLIPFFVIGVALAANTALMERTRVGAVGADWDFTLAERTLIAGRALWFYASKLLWPVNLTFIYPRWEIDAGSVTQWLFPIGAAIVVTAAFMLRHRIGRGPVVALLFFGGTLAPALGFVNVYPMRFSFVADHFQYVAGIGLLTLFAAGLSRHQLVERASFVVPVALAVLTWRQTHIYRDLETLWADTIARNPSAWLAHNNLGTVLRDRGDVDRAIERYREAIRLKPDYYEAQGNLGAALLRRGAVEEARRHTDEALRVRPDFAPALINRAAILLRDGRPDDAILVLQNVLKAQENDAEALNTLGSAFAMRGDLQNAERAFELALRERPSLVSARVNLARVLMSAGRIESAAHQVDQALAFSPGDSDARNAKGMLLLARGEPAEALAYFRDLVRVAPSDASAHFNLGTLLSQSGRGDEAIAEFQAAIRLNPQHAEARNNLGVAYLIVERYDAAAEQFGEAIKLRRTNPEAYNNLAFALIRLGRREEAVSSLREALRLRPDYPEALQQLRQLGASPD
jgi:Flp pilus assembly protein TadD